MRADRNPTSSRTQSEAGATAILVALLSTVLFGVAALSVDLGNAWARQRQLQTQVDLSAMSAGWKLPADNAAKRTAAAAEVASYLAAADNRVFGQDTVTAAQLLDSSRANGELTFSADGTRMSLVAPASKVSFAFAGVLGQSSTDVQATATVQVRTEIPAEDVLPFWLPDGCAWGPVHADTANGSSGSGGGGGPTGTGVNSSRPAAFTSTATPMTATAGLDNVSISVSVDPVGSVGSVDATKDPEVLFEHSSDPALRFDRPGTWTKRSGPPPWTFTISLNSADVLSAAGSWRYQTKVHNDYSGVGSFTVTGGSTGPVTCTGSARGNFGQLDSPRASGSQQKQTVFALNIAEGLDHLIEAFPNAPRHDCESPVIGRWDNVSRDGNNCIKGDTGNDGPAVYNGLIGGVDGKDGRIASDRQPTKTGCNGGSNVLVNGTSVNNDLLSCYMTDPARPLSSLTAASGVTTDMLTPDVMDSPRFVWLPIVYAPDRGLKTFQPIRKFTPGFITDESATSTRSNPAYTDTVRDNGVTVNGNSVRALQIFTFNPDALGVQDSSPTMEFNPASKRAIVRLVD